MAKLLVISFAIFLILAPIILVWNTIEFGLICKNQQNLKNSFTNQPDHDKNYETDETSLSRPTTTPSSVLSLSANGDPEKEV